jgi:hypothetical protein
MSVLKVDQIQDTAGGNTVTINGATPTTYNTMGRNRIINGGMQIDQRNAGAAVTTNNAYPVDRFQYQNDSDATLSLQQSSTVPAGFSKSMAVTVTTADASVGATQYSMITQRIEGFNMADFGWGTASAKTVTLSFWVRSSVTGTFGGVFNNDGSARSYPYTYSISSADTWEYKTVTIAGDTSGTWLSTNGVGIQLRWAFGMGSTYAGSAGSWSANTYFGASGCVNLISTLNATFYITGVQLEVGSVATEFERRPYGTEFMLCQRYYQHYGGSGSTGGTGYAYEYDGLYGSSTGSGLVISFPFPVVMRAAPTSSGNYTDISNVNTYSFSTSVSGVAINCSTLSSGRTAMRFGTNGYLNLTAEL